MFDSLTNRFSEIFRNVRGMGKITEKNIKVAVRSIKLSLLEADVDYNVVKDFVADVQKRFIGENVSLGVLPDQQFIKIVHEELCHLMGQVHVDIKESAFGATFLMLVGIQGSGKTTTCAKLVLFFKKQKKKVILVSTDVYRPAAIKQLQVLSQRVGVDFFDPQKEKNPVKIAQKALDYVRNRGYDYVIFDTAGRMDVNQELMEELNVLKTIIKPHEIIFVADAMMGQSALNIAKSFEDSVGIEGIIINKLDGDTRSGVIFSIKKVLGKTIKFVGVGEKPEEMEVFHPKRFASRILGMGDIVSLVEKAEHVMDKKRVKDLEHKVLSAEIDCNDFLWQLRQMKKMGSLKSILNFLPGGSQMTKYVSDDRSLVHIEAMILSMTPYERKHPHLIKGSRRRRIAHGSGCEVHQVNRFLKQFESMKKMMKKMKNSSSLKKSFKNIPDSLWKNTPFR